jgi:hypothetical protein
MSTPNYTKIYKDLILTKYPEKWSMCEKLITNDPLSVMDIIKINNTLFNHNSDKGILKFNQRHRSYTKTAIFHILNYQKEHQLNNTQVAKHFKTSRNTIAKWKKVFLTEFKNNHRW